MAAAVDGRRDARVVGGLDGQRRAAVKGVARGQNAAAPRVEGGELQGVFVGLGPRVDQEEVIVVVARGAAQAFGQLRLQVVLHRVGVEAQALQLRADGLDVAGMAVANADDGVAAVEVEIFAALAVPHVAAAAFHNLDVEERIDVEKIHFALLFMGRRGGRRA